MKNLFLLLTVAAVVVTLAGCSVNTKLVERERVDQQISGNQGYFMGTPPPTGERKTTRKYYEVQVEMPVDEESRIPKKAPQEEVRTAPVTNYSASQVEEEDTVITTIDIEERVEFATYTVQKGDTLQKISMKLFGTTKNWKKIFDANSDILKSPNKIRPGMVIRIPIAESVMIEENEYIK